MRPVFQANPVVGSQRANVLHLYIGLVHFTDGFEGSLN